MVNKMTNFDEIVKQIKDNPYGICRIVTLSDLEEMFPPTVEDGSFSQCQRACKAVGLVLTYSEKNDKHLICPKED